MAGQGTAVKAASIDNAFASTERQLRANAPFFGAVSRIRNGQHVLLDYVRKQDRLTLPKWLDQKDISQGQFLLETQNENGNEITIEFMVDKNADSAPDNPFLRNMPQTQQQSGMSTALKEEYEAQVLKLRGKVNELTDELVEAKRKLGDDKTETLLTHEKEKRQLEKEKDAEIRRLENEISELNTEIRFKELEMNQENGGPSLGNRVLDILQNNLGDDFLSSLAANIGNMMQQGGNQQPTQAQIQQAIQQTADNGQPEAPQQNSGTEANQARNNPKQEMNESQAARQSQPQQPPTEEQKAQVKQQFIDGLKNAAVDALTADNDQLEKYATAVRNQMAINEQAGINLDAAQWVQMAKMLANKAVKEEVSADRVAKVIEPLLASVPGKYKFTLKMLDPAAATNQLFKQFNIEASPAVKGVVTKVLDVLKNPNKT